MTKLSAVTPMATIMPAMPGRLRAKPTESPSSTTVAYVIRPATASEETTTTPSPREYRKQNPTTRIRPMMPAMMPARSCSLPRVAETFDTSDTSNDRGSAPYLSTLASSVADCWLKLPEISARPPGIDELTDGAEITSESSTMAKRFCGSVRLASSPVADSKAAAPSELKSRLTTHARLFCGTPACAPVRSLPSIRVGPSRYFSVFSWLQANNGWSET